MGVFCATGHMWALCGGWYVRMRLTQRMVCTCMCVSYVDDGVQVGVIGASQSEPHTSVTALHTCVCMYVCLLACLLTWNYHLP